VQAREVEVDALRALALERELEVAQLADAGSPLDKYGASGSGTCPAPDVDTAGSE
jgi:hypothetical protein